MPKDELTDAQLEQCDLIKGLAYQAMCDMLGKEELEWDIEWIGELIEFTEEELLAVLHFKSKLDD